MTSNSVLIRMAEPEVTVKGDLVKIPNVHQTIITPKEEPMEIDQYIPQDYTICASELMRDEKIMRKEEMDNRYQPILPDSRELLDKQPRMAGGTVAEEYSYSQQQINIFHDHSYCIKKRQVKQSDTAMKCPKCLYYTRSALSWVQHLTKNHSTTPVLSGFALLCECGVVSQSSAHSRLCEIANFTVISRSPTIDVAKTTPKCILCDIYPATPIGYIAHLRKYHETSLRANAIFIICSCGDELRSQSRMQVHRKQCGSRQFTVSKEIFEDSQSTLVQPNDESAENEISNQFEVPLYHHANHVLESNEYSGDDDYGALHGKTGHESEMRTTSVVKKNKKQKYSDTEIGCPECEYRTCSAGSWVEHLRNKHLTTPIMAGFALLCECGNVSFSNTHSRVCVISNFTVIRTRDEPIKRFYDEKATPQCILCEMYPATGHEYLDHLLRHHKTTLMANGIYLTCACGFKITCDSRPLRDHNKTCRGREFTVHNLEEM